MSSTTRAKVFFWPGCRSDPTIALGGWSEWLGVNVVHRTRRHVTVRDAAAWPRVIELMFAAGITQAWDAVQSHNAQGDRTPTA